MDRLDRKILRLLQEDATLAVADVAKKVGLSTTPCWRRIQKLEEEGVIKRRVAVRKGDASAPSNPAPASASAVPVSAPPASAPAEKSAPASAKPAVRTPKEEESAVPPPPPSRTSTPLPASALWVLSCLMLLGRLELFTVLVLLTRGYWRR